MHRNNKTEVRIKPQTFTDGSVCDDQQTDSFTGTMPRQSFDYRVQCERSIRQIHEELKHYLDEQLESKITRLSRSIDERSQAMQLYRSET
jgi:hypothetical protein